MGDSAEIPKDVAKALDKALQGNKELQNTLKHNKDLMNQFVSATQTYKSVLDDVQSLYKDSEKDLMKTIKLQQGLVDLDGKRLGTSAKLRKLAKDNENIARDISSVYASEALLFDSLLLKQNMMNTGLQGEYAQLLTTYMLENNISDVTDHRVKALVDELKGRQHIYEKASKQLELDEATALKLAEIKEETEEWKHSLTKVFETAKAIGRDPKVFGAFMLTQMVEKAELLHKGFEDLSTSGLTVGQRVQSMAKGFSLMSVLGLSDTKGVLAGMVEQMGTMNSLTSAEVDHVGHLAKEMGVTGQEAFGLVEGFSKLPGETMATATHAADYVKSLSEANGVAPGKITKEIAKNTELMALGGYKSAKAFTLAAMKAQKMGVELSTSKNVMNGLLNFEDSLNAQMEASVLLGKEINLDKARELALNGKSVEATAEVLKNIGGQAEFEKMNVKQKEALAKASGMSVEELSKALDAQKEQGKYSGEEASWMMKKLGLVAEVGGAVIGFAKENAMMLAASVQLIGRENIAKVASWAVDKAKFAWEKTAAAARAGWAMLSGKGAAGAATGAAGKAGASVAGSVASKAAGNVSTLASGATPAPTAGLGVAAFLKGLAMGLKEFASGKVLVGAGVLALSMVLFGLGIAGFAKALSLIPIKDLLVAAVALPIFALGFKFMTDIVGKINLGSVAKGALALGLIGLAIIPAAIAFRMLKDVPVENMIAFSIALPLLALAAAGIGLLILPIGLGAIALAALGVGMIAVAGGLMVLQAAEGGIKVFESLAAVAANASGLGGVAIAMIGIAGGLSLMAYTGLAAMPVILALMALAAVAPALTGLGASLGGMFGGGGGDKEDKMDTLIAKVDTLISVASKGGVINMDGKKVGDILRTSINSSGVR